MNLDGYVGVFGGTFDPPHLGHLNLAVELYEKCRLSKIIFIPAFVSPLRTAEKFASADARLKMCQLATQSLPQFEVSSIEVNSPRPSYTIDTLRELKKTIPNLVLCLGEDTLASFTLWKEYQEIMKLVPIVIGSRFLREPLVIDPLLTELYENCKVETALFDIAATTVRARLKNNLYCGHLLPAKVLDYIYENQLYFRF